MKKNKVEIKDIEKRFVIHVKTKLDFSLLVGIAMKHQIIILREIYQESKDKNQELYVILLDGEFKQLIYSSGDFKVVKGYKIITLNEINHGITLKSAFKGLAKEFVKYLKSVFNVNYIRTKRFLKRYYLTICNVFTAIIYFCYGVNYNESFGYWVIFGMLILNYILEGQMERNQKVSDELIDLNEENFKKQDEILNGYEILNKSLQKENRELRQIVSLTNRQNIPNKNQ